MSCKEFNLDNVSGHGCQAIEQGATFNSLFIYYKNLDLSTWIPDGDIRTNFAYKEGIELATFSFEPLVFSSVTSNNETFNATVIRPTLTAVQTLALPIPLSRQEGDRVIVGKNAWVYDIKLKSPQNEVVIVCRGLVDVIPDTSRTP